MLRGFQLLLMFLAGAALGLCYFGGLAWTVRRWSSGGGVVLILGSFLLRSAALLAGFWLLAQNHAEGWIASLVGFTAARIVLQRAVPVQYWASGREEGDASHH